MNVILQLPEAPSINEQKDLFAAGEVMDMILLVSKSLGIYH